MTDEVQTGLNYLKEKKYPILSFSEIIRVVVSKEIASTKSSAMKKFDREPTSDELMALAQDAFYVNDKDEVEYHIEDAKKPFTY
jgi:hypothetical protein